MKLNSNQIRGLNGIVLIVFISLIFPIMLGVGLWIGIQIGIQAGEYIKGHV